MLIHHDFIQLQSCLVRLETYKLHSCGTPTVYQDFLEVFELPFQVILLGFPCIYLGDPAVNVIQDDCGWLGCVLKQCLVQQLYLQRSLAVELLSLFSVIEIGY